MSLGLHYDEETAPARPKAAESRPEESVGGLTVYNQGRNTKFNTTFPPLTA
jgi:hypothetical protein